MKTETDLPQITRKQIGNTVYIIENTVSAGPEKQPTTRWAD